MRRILAVSAVLCFIVMASVVAWHNLKTAPTSSPSFAQADASRGRFLADYAKLPLSFEPNLGQTDDRVHFLTRGDGYTVFLAGNEADIRLESTSPESANQASLSILRSPVPRRPRSSRSPSRKPVATRYLKASILNLAAATISSATTLPSGIVTFPNSAA